MSHRPSCPNRRAFLGMSAAAAVALPGLSRAEARALDRIKGRAFGTAWRVTAHAGRGLEALRSEIERVLDEVDRQMSPWRADSEIAGYNAAGTSAIWVSDDTVTVVQAALDLARASGGAFDPTVGPLVGRWGFGPITDGARGWQSVATGKGLLAKGRPRLTLDLCGIAKGWALDRVAGLLRAAGHADALIDIGGELAGFGRHPSGRAWQVAVEDPLAGGAAGVLALTDRAVATSGLAAQSYGVSGPDRSHIIDPATGAPVRGALRSVSVIAMTAMEADGWATALFAAGAVKGPALAERHGIGALFLSDAAGRLEARSTGDFARYLA